jgi:hypothetical protein
MSSRASLQHFVSTTEPTGSTLGDEWYDPSNNVLYKRIALSSGVRWVNISGLGSSVISAAVSTSNSSNFTFDGTNIVIASQGSLRFGSANSNYVAFRSGPVVGSNVTWTLPTADGTNNQILTTNGAGFLSWSNGVITPFAVSDQNNASTGFFAVPSGNTAQRSANPPSGATRYNTSVGVGEIYSGTQWLSYGTPTQTIEYLVVAGGGGGGGWDNGGGGGAGGMQVGSINVQTGGTATVTVGGGGTGRGNPRTARGDSGSNSVFGSILSVGGGGGGTDVGGNNFGNPSSGGSGGPGGSGGGGTAAGGSGGIGIVGQGNSGGNNGSGTGIYAAGGGGGAGAAGSGGTGSSGTGAGGVGASSSITGPGTFYAGGGGGASNGSAPAGGNGGGGTGGGRSPGQTGGITGGTNLGGGGGGANLNVNSNGANGGSGVVIIAYPSSFANLTSIGGGLSFTFSTATRPGFRVYTFTSGTGQITY